MFTFNGKRIKSVSFVGFGKSNKAIYEYLQRYKNLRYTIRCDAKKEAEFPKDVKLIFGDDYLSKIDEDILFLSPSVRRDKKEFAKSLLKGAILSSDIEFFSKYNKNDVYAVTGSDGKSTTTYLTSKLLASAYNNAYPTGNFGEPLTPHLDDGEDTAYATELSSFQLNYHSPKSKRAVITNISKNHLNWHSSYGEYIRAKLNVYANTDEPILNYDDNLIKNISKKLKAYIAISKNEGLSSLRQKISAEEYITLENGKILLSGKKVLNVSEIRANDEYNLYNFMSAIALTHGVADRDAIRALAKEFTSLPHRCEYVGTFDGVKYYDSSIDSSPKRTETTLSRFSSPVIIILGGREKGLEFDSLIKALNQKTKYIVLTGETEDLIEEAILRFPNFSVPYVKRRDFFAAIDAAAEYADKSDTVLLSPAATSYDKFNNFEERGAAFKDYIMKRNKK